MNQNLSLVDAPSGSGLRSLGRSGGYPFILAARSLLHKVESYHLLRMKAKVRAEVWVAEVPRNGPAPFGRRGS